MELTENQKELVAKYFSDISKLVFAATVLDFFVHVTGQSVSKQVLFIGSLVTVFLFVFSVIIRK